MEEIEVTSLQEYIDFVEKNAMQYSLSRGQEKDKDLLPTALRKDDHGNRLYSPTVTKSFVDDFKINSPMYNESTSVNNDNEMLVLAQHFGVPTQLLDFTYSHLISLMFSVENAFSYKDDDGEQSVVWFLDPKELNLNAISRRDLFDMSGNENIPTSVELPIAVTARKNNKRIAAQNGLFVYFQQNSEPLNKISVADSVLKKVVIKHEYGRKILSSLYTMGMRFSEVYPELASVSKDILLKNNVTEYYKMEEEND